MNLKDAVLLILCGALVGMGAGQISWALGAGEQTVLVVTFLVAVLSSVAFLLLYKRFHKTA